MQASEQPAVPAAIGIGTLQHRSAYRIEVVARLVFIAQGDAIGRQSERFLVSEIICVLAVDHRLLCDTGVPRYPLGRLSEFGSGQGGKIAGRVDARDPAVVPDDKPVEAPF